MADPNLRNFYGRVARIEKAHSKGYGFEAKGTLGRSFYTRPRRPRIPVLKPLLLTLLVGLGLKAGLHVKIGAEGYEARVAGLAAGSGLDRAGSVLLQADPVTVYVADQIRRIRGST